MLKKLYLGAEEAPLLAAARLCVDSAVGQRVCLERPGAEEIRRRAYEELLEENFDGLVKHPIGRLQLLWMRAMTGGSSLAETALTEGYRALEELQEKAVRSAGKTEKLQEDDNSSEKMGMALIRATEYLYNHVVDPHFERRHGGLDAVFSVTLEELQEFNWKDFLDEEALERTLESYQEQISQQLTDSASGSRRRGSGSMPVVQISAEEQKKRRDYTALNFGPTYLPEEEEKRRQRLLCRGAHGDSRLYYTEGILRAPLVKNYQYQYVKRQTEVNETYYRRNRTLARKSIQQLTETLRKSLLRRSEPETSVGDSGAVIPGLLWKVGRTDSRRLFLRQERQDQMDFVVDILIDASGSQRKRQSQVAMQAYIISEALTNLRIPHRVMSFCSFWNTTVLQRFRDYGDGPEKNKRIFELFASSNNRDGLAVRASAYELLQQPQEGKVLIVLSDGRPNDRVIYQDKSRSDQPNAPLYGDEYAVRDTAHEIRRVRAHGVSVLGVFAGEEEDLPAERRIFGKDFAYIHDISGFSHMVGKYMKQLLEEI